jgi:hypothetical protein
MGAVRGRSGVESESRTRDLVKQGQANIVRATRFRNFSLERKDYNICIASVAELSGKSARPSLHPNLSTPVIFSLLYGSVHPPPAVFNVGLPFPLKASERAVRVSSSDGPFLLAETQDGTAAALAISSFVCGVSCSRPCALALSAAGMAAARHTPAQRHALCRHT